MNAFAIYPSLKSVSSPVVAPYNAVLATSEFLTFANKVTIFENEAIYDICRNNLKVVRPTYANMNRLIAKVVTSMTASLRFEGSLNDRLIDLETNHVPYPRLCFLTAGFAPLTTRDKLSQAENWDHRLALASFETDSIMIKADPSQHKYMACSLLFRGEWEHHEVMTAIRMVKAKPTI